MDDFLKQFKDNLDNQPEPVFEQKDWQSLNNRLNEQRQKRPFTTWLLWVLIPLFLMSLLANGFQFKESVTTSQKMAFLESRFDSVVRHTLVMQVDTVYKINTTYQRDTVYKTKIVRETEIVYLPFSKGLLNTRMLSDKSLLNDSTRALEQKSSDNFAANIYEQTISNRDKMLNTNDLDKLQALKTPFLTVRKPSDLPVLDIKPIVINTKKTLIQRLEPLRPKAYSAGVLAGLAYPISDISSKPSGYTVGVQGAVAFSPYISLWADAQYLQLNYQTDRMNEAIGIPVVTPPSSDFKFNLVKVSQPKVQFITGLRYHFEGKKRWQPYFGVGYGAVTSLPYEVDYEFKNTSLGTVWEFSQKIKKQDTQWGFLMFDGGFETRLSRQYRWQIGGNYRINLSKTNYSYRLLSLKTGVLFDF